MSELATIDISDLDDDQRVVRFTYEDDFGRETDGVLIFFDGEWLAYRNVCPHLGVPLDCAGGDVFDTTGRSLVCDMHGARFQPHDGHCTMGPCEGDRLKRLDVRIDDEERAIVRKSRLLNE